MKKILSLLLVVCCVLVTFTGCKDNQSEGEVVAIINDHKVYMSDIEQDILFVSRYGNIDMNNEANVKAMVYDIINTYLIDYMCEKELESLGMSYNKEYYGASYESLVEAYGSESNLEKYIKSFGLTKEYVQELCIKQARKSTLSEYLINEFLKTYSVSEAEIMDYYLENEKDWQTEYVRSFYFLTFGSEEAAKGALEDIALNDFMTYYNAQKDIQTCDFYGYLEHYEKEDFPEAVRELLFTIEVGNYYPEPMNTFANTGYTLIYVAEHIDGYKYTYAEMRDAIESGLEEYAIDEHLKTFFEELNKKYKVEILYH